MNDKLTKTKPEPQLTLLGEHIGSGAFERKRDENY